MAATEMKGLGEAPVTALVHNAAQVRIRGDSSSLDKQLPARSTTRASSLGGCEMVRRIAAAVKRAGVVRWRLAVEARCWA